MSAAPRGDHIPASPIDRWHEIIGDPTYADAILDRLNRATLIASNSPAKACVGPAMQSAKAGPDTHSRP